MSMKCPQCGSDLRSFELAIHDESQITTHVGFACSQCDADVAPYISSSTAGTNPWEGVADKVAEAEVIGKKIGKDGDYYKPGAFGFSWYNNVVQAIIFFNGKEPDVTPICDGFGSLEWRVTLETEEEHSNGGL